MIANQRVQGVFNAAASSQHRVRRLPRCVRGVDGMWVRSYSALTNFAGDFGSLAYVVVSLGYGGISLLEFAQPVGPSHLPTHEIWPWSITTKPAPVIDKVPTTDGFLISLGFYARTTNGPFEARLPFWLLVLTSGSLAMLLQMKWPWRFTLRSLFIATTLIAVVLGMSAWLDRAWIGK